MHLLENWKRWLIWAALVLVFAVACSFLSNWQFSRRAEALAKIQSVATNFDQAPVALDEVAGSDAFDAKNEWRPVTLSGKFLIDHAVLVRNRPYNGSPGFLQLIPFQLDSGNVVAVETGWLPTGDDNHAPKIIPLPPATEQQIVARVRPSEPTLNRDAPAKQLGTINVQALIEKEALSGPVYKNFYVRLASPYSSAQFPKVLPRPELDEGNHLSYALQWILFALMAVSALVWAIKHETQAQRMKIDPSYQPKVRRKVGDADKAAEDAAL